MSMDRGEQKQPNPGDAGNYIPDSLYRKAVLVHAKKGSIFVQKNEKAEFAYFILKGKLYVQSEFMDGNVYNFSFLGKGSVVSDLEVLSGTFIYAATVVVAEDVTALEVPVKLFADELKKNPEFLYCVADSLSRKMYSATYERGRNLFKLSRYKVVLYLIRSYEIDLCEHMTKLSGSLNRALGTKSGEACFDGRFKTASGASAKDKTEQAGETKCCLSRRETVKIEKNRTVIASEIGISVKTLNRALKVLKEEGYISISKGKITIDAGQFQRLADLAEEKALY